MAEKRNVSWPGDDEHGIQLATTRTNKIIVGNILIFDHDRRAIPGRVKIKYLRRRVHIPRFDFLLIFLFLVSEPPPSINHACKSLLHATLPFHTNAHTLPAPIPLPTFCSPRLLNSLPIPRCPHRSPSLLILFHPKHPHSPHPSSPSPSPHSNKTTRDDRSDGCYSWISRCWIYDWTWDFEHAVWW